MHKLSICDCYDVTGDFTNRYITTCKGKSYCCIRSHRSKSYYINMKVYLFHLRSFFLIENKLAHLPNLVLTVLKSNVYLFFLIIVVQ